MTHIIRSGLISMLCIFNFLSILLVVNHWFPLNTIIFKTLIFGLLVLGILSTVLLSVIPTGTSLYENIVNFLYYSSFVIFGVCVISAIANISRFGLARGTTLYDEYSLPAIFPVVSGVILYLLKK